MAGCWKSGVGPSGASPGLPGACVGPPAPGGTASCPSGTPSTGSASCDALAAAQEALLDQAARLMRAGLPHQLSALLSQDTWEASGDEDSHSSAGGGGAPALPLPHPFRLAALASSLTRPALPFIPHADARMAGTDVGGPSSMPGEGGDCHMPAVAVSSGRRRKRRQERDEERRPLPLLDLLGGGRVAVLAEGGRVAVLAEGGHAGLAPSSAHLKRDWAAGPENDGQDDGRMRSASRIDALPDPRRGLLFEGGVFPFEDEDPRGDAVSAEAQAEQGSFAVAIGKASDG